MERPCYQCGLTVEDILVFCPQCRAPQIRVISTMPAPQPMPLRILRRPAVTSSAAIDWSHAIPSVILAVLIGALLNHADFNGPILLLCGALSVVVYGQGNKLTSISRRVGILLGAISGVLATAVTGFFHFKDDIQQLAAQAFQMSLAHSPDAATRQTWQDLIAKHPDFLPVMALLVIGIMSLIIASFGGMIGASLVNRWRPAVPTTSPDHETSLDSHEKTERSDHD